MTALAYIDVLSIDTLGLPSKTTRALQYLADIETIGELRRKTPKELRKIPCIGKKGVEDIIEVLRNFPPPE
ncbi:MAG TPA: DNA-directed RNA polymerase subunit alpha C-terminal domain-containing protein [Candidatus Paceibacterota bacterium]|nr:DNA-directed RNA polymerase subunit alpha C-terminal domain-containing protein [Candidatus Paceibacterota bacterium]